MLKSFLMLTPPGELLPMREAVQPKYNKVKAVCVCGNTIETGSVMSEIRLDVCSACHPFFTGTQKIMDTEGRVEKFKKRYAKPDQK